MDPIDEMLILLFHCSLFFSSPAVSSSFFSFFCPVLQ